jgi:hypothetical protein
MRDRHARLDLDIHPLHKSPFKKDGLPGQARQQPAYKGVTNYGAVRRGEQVATKRIAAVAEQGMRATIAALSNITG